MATPGATEFSVENMLQATLTMRSVADVEKKKAAMSFLNRFQRSMEAWGIVIGILQSSEDAEALSFASITLKGKIQLDLSTQIPETELPNLRTQILVLLRKFARGPKPVRVQLCVCLAILAIYMKDWQNVLEDVATALGTDTDGLACLLDFLKVLPEEVTEGRKITLSEEELSQRTTELLGNNSERVVTMLIDYASSSAEAAANPQLMECITAWLREVPVNLIVKTPLLSVVLQSLHNETTLEPAAECLGTICRETRDVDDNRETIQILLPKIIELRPLLQKAVKEEDTESYRALTKVFADAGNSWVVAIAREPQSFQALVEALLEACASDKERDVIEHTFAFWYELKQYLTLDIYADARNHFAPAYSTLVDVLLKQLEFPQSESGNEDLFDGDREVEEKFREFRHHMGDTLKDACEVLGVSVCLTKVLDAITIWAGTYGSQANGTNVPHWQELEAPLFAMRAMGRMVPPSEDVVLPKLMKLLFDVPAHEKLRFATIMVFSRYTEWTAEHHEFLEPQFNYIVSSFSTDSKEIVRAAAQAIKFFCEDCRDLLSGQVLQLQTFYDQILDQLPEPSQNEITEGVASVVAVQKPDDIFELLKRYCTPLIERLMHKANNATNKEGKLAIADHVQLITIFVQKVRLYTPERPENPAVKYWKDVFNVLSTVLDNFIDFAPICERICRCWRHMLISYRTDMLPVLEAGMANKLVHGFATSKQGCFLWVTGAVLREFSEDRERVSEAVMDSIYAFFDTQAKNVLGALEGMPPADMPDVIEDFFRLLVDALLYHHQKLIPSPLFPAILEASLVSLQLQEREPLSATLHFLRDLLTYGSDNPVGSTLPPGEAQQQLQLIVRAQLVASGQSLIQRVMNGMLHTFPSDCFADGSGVLLAMFQLMPAQTTAWVEQAIGSLPVRSFSPAEASRLMLKIKEKLEGGDASQIRQVRVLLQDFTNSYRRRNVQTRDGVGMDEVFHFKG